MNRVDFINQALIDFVSIDGFSSYKAVKVNEKEVSNMPEKLVKQLKKEGLYDNSYVGLVVLNGMEDFPIEVSSLPIYGVKKNYDTSCLKETKKEAILADLETMQFNLTN